MYLADFTAFAAIFISFSRIVSTCSFRMCFPVLIYVPDPVVAFLDFRYNVAERTSRIAFIVDQTELFILQIPIFLFDHIPDSNLLSILLQLCDSLIRGKAPFFLFAVSDCLFRVTNAGFPHLMQNPAVSSI